MQPGAARAATSVRNRATSPIKRITEPAPGPRLTDVPVQPRPEAAVPLRRKVIQTQRNLRVSVRAADVPTVRA